MAGGRDPFDLRDDALPGMDFAFVDHQVTDDEPPDLAGPGIRIRYAADPSFSRIVVHRSSSTSGPPPLPAPYASISSADPPGIFMDTAVAPGTEYCYRLLPFDAAGNAGRPSGVFCAIARSDPAEIWASVVINGGAPRTDNPVLDLRVVMYNKAPAGFMLQSVVEDAVVGDPYAFTRDVKVSAPVVSVPTTVRAGVAIIDPADDGSPPVFTDEIVLHPAGSLGGISGRVESLSAKGGSVTSLPVLVQLCADDTSISHCMEPSLVPAADGSFALADVVPGNYQLYVHPGWIDTTPTPVSVEAGQTTEIGTTAVNPDALFVSGFEGAEVF